MQQKNDSPRTIRNLIIIESAGKIPALTAALKRSPIDDFYILATGGHLFEHSPSLGDVGISRSLSETGRQAKRPQQTLHIQQWAQKSHRVLLACDADQEGDVLACDLARILEEVEHSNYARVRLRSLDLEGIMYAFLHPESISQQDSWPGTSRRILDRLIGATYSARDVMGVDLSVGRIQSAMLGAASREKLAFGQATIVLASCDAKQPFIATVEVTAENLKEVQSLVEQAKEFEKNGQCIAFGKSAAVQSLKPWSYGQSVMSIAQATSRPIDDVSRTMQRLYETGRMSYPRSDACSITTQAISTIQCLSDDNGIRFDATHVPVFSRKDKHAHESPRILQPTVKLTSPLGLLNDDEAALCLIARHLVACGQPHAVHSPSAGSIPKWAEGLKLERKVCQWLQPWPSKAEQTGIRIFPSEELALALLLRHKLGRPSTLVFHALKFSSRGLIENDGKVSKKAENWVKRTPMVLQDPKTSSTIEKILASSNESNESNESNGGKQPAVLVKSLLESMNLWQEVSAMLKNSDSLKDYPSKSIFK